MTESAHAAWLQHAQEFQKTMADNWTKAFETFQNMDLGPLGAKLQAPTVQPPKIAFIPEKLQAVQTQYMQEAAALIQAAFKGEIELDDRRFSDPAWKANPMAAFTAASYLLNAKTLLALVDAVDTDDKTRARIRFMVEQVNAAAAPSNFLFLNAEAQKLALETQGASIARGVQNLIHDIQQGHVSMTDESLFHVGKNVATTEGAVVFENEYFQLIEYKPLTEKVYERPFLFVPPSINKYYILDLQPDNSMVRYIAAQGHRTFIVSWRNPDASLAQATWDDYIEHAVIKAITVTREISGAKTINALGFCVGGTMLGTALAVLAARGEQPVESVTLLTSMLDFSDTGVLDVFIDENFVRYREAQMGHGGLMKGSDMATTFSFLRPNDLVWNYVVGNYLKGETPPPFDLLYWNSDSTNLPGPFYCWYLRNTYLENNLTKPGKAEVCGQKIDLGKITIPAYIYGSREDHIVPIGGAYASTRFLGGEKRFVMGASGHIAGVINPPAKKKRNHWVRDDGQLPPTVDEWLAGARDVPGSWWTDWAQWLAQRAGKQIPAPKSYGKGKYKVIEPAPGRYVLAKA
ncbi:MAG: class I poly(R)-hydroxyalkanoic acid synthase [Rhodoferax sp.]